MGGANGKPSTAAAFDARGATKAAAAAPSEAAAATRAQSALDTEGGGGDAAARARAKTTDGANATEANATEADDPIPRPTFEVANRNDEVYDVDAAVDDAGEWLRSQLAELPISRDYPHIIDECVQVMKKWKRNFPQKVWLRVVKGDRLAKELNESAPVIERALKYVDAIEVPSPDERVVIVDLCSGFGYLAMFLSELLPAEKVREIILVDKMWSMFGLQPKPHHINWEHVYGVGDWKYDWPIQMTTRKVDLKERGEVHQLAMHVFNRWNGPFIVLGIHLCGTLSIKAVELFNKHPNTQHLILKPCCLPDFSWTYRADHFPPIGKHKHLIPTKEVCSRGKWKRNKWVGPPRSYLQAKFVAWNDHLCKAIEEDDGNITKSIEEIKVQTSHFQNLFIFGERQRLSKCSTDIATGVKFPTPSGTEAGAWCPTGTGYGTHYGKDSLRRVAKV